MPMRDYDFAGLSTRSFEKLVQALALKELGSNLMVYGDGPDGGREATFEGRAKTAPKAEPWDGYIVLQAKFRQRLQNTKADADWVLTELKKELAVFADRKSGRKLPDYYIFATNAVLTAVNKRGTKDKAIAILAAFQKKWKLKGWWLWDFDQLKALLDGNESIRRA